MRSILNFLYNSKLGKFKMLHSVLIKRALKHGEFLICSKQILFGFINLFPLYNLGVYKLVKLMFTLALI